MFKRLTRIEKLIEEFKNDTTNKLHDVEKVLIVQEANLQQHMQRSDNLENLVKMESEKRSAVEKKVNKYTNMIEGGLKLIGFLLVLVGILSGLVKIFAFFI